MHDISTAPRDGKTLIRISADGEEPMIAKWVKDGARSDFDKTKLVGIWTNDNGDTWSEEHGAGPTHWKPV